MQMLEQGMQLAVVGLDRIKHAELWRVIESSRLGVEAFDCAETFLAEAGLWDVLICHAHLEGMCGLELQRRLTVAGNTCPIWIVADHAHDSTKAWQLGHCSAYLEQPHAASLKARIRGWPVGRLQKAPVLG
ncbi:hypothetical protein [uncultured Salinisphaera sp.]|uniref:hypothetical protein n=1 Tax=uncultured Salinisphaera sp. TaxID=359372 RepID=UPI0032B2F692|tara:strand:- start:2426 stop:2818 length:393 start_codon:yes stop_codon:yes gene_type:complete